MIAKEREKATIMSQRLFFMHSDRISFSYWTENDFELAYSLWGSPDVAFYVTDNKQFNADEIQCKLNLEIGCLGKFGVQYYPLFLKSTGEFIGTCGLKPYADEKNVCEIGFYLLPQFWSQGYAKEAVRRVLEYALYSLKIKNIYAGHNPENQSSRKILEALGFKKFKNEFYEPTGLAHPLYRLIEPIEVEV